MYRQIIDGTTNNPNTPPPTEQQHQNDHTYYTMLRIPNNRTNILQQKRSDSIKTHHKQNTSHDTLGILHTHHHNPFLSPHHEQSGCYHYHVLSVSNTHTPRITTALGNKPRNTHTSNTYWCWYTITQPQQTQYNIYTKPLYMMAQGVAHV